MSILLIVESGAKSKKIQSYLGSEYIVYASFGHIIDLKKKELANLEQVSRRFYSLTLIFESLGPIIKEKN